MKRVSAVFITIAALTLTGCGDKNVGSSSENLPSVTTNQGEAPTIGTPVGNPPTTLVTKDIIVGSGVEAVATSTMTVHYTLMTWSNGQLIETSWSSGSPSTFALDKVIVGWQQGIPGMKVGGRRLLVIPPDLGYGAAGGGPIGPNETLIFVVDAIGVA